MTGLELSAILKELGWSGAELGRRVDVHEKTVSKWRNGHRDVPGPVAVYLNLALAVKRLGGMVE